MSGPEDRRLRGIIRPHLLLAEGPDDEAVTRRLLRDTGLADVQVHTYDGRNKLSEALYALPAVTGFADLEVLAVTRDADESAEAAFRSIRAALEKRRLPVPDSNGGSARAGTLTVWVTTIPPGRESGEIEDLVVDSLSNEVRDCLDSYFTCQGTALGLQPKKPGKSRLQCWLAALDGELHRGMRDEVDRIDVAHPAFGPLREFLRRAFASPSDAPRPPAATS